MGKVLKHDSCVSDVPVRDIQQCLEEQHIVQQALAEVGRRLPAGGSCLLSVEEERSSLSLKEH